MPCGIVRQHPCNIKAGNVLGHTDSNFGVGRQGTQRPNNLVIERDKIANPFQQFAAMRCQFHHAAFAAGEQPVPRYRLKFLNLQ